MAVDCIKGQWLGQLKYWLMNLVYSEFNPWESGSTDLNLVKTVTDN